MAYEYSVYGLQIRLSRPIDLLHSIEISECDVYVDLSNKTVPFDIGKENLTIDFDDKNGIEIIDAGKWIFIAFVKSSNEKLCFYVSKDGATVISEHPRTIPDQDVESFLLGPVLGCVLRLKNKICIHASVLEYEGKAFAFVGHKGAGKSTTAASLLQAGAKLVSDDVAVLSSNCASKPIVNPGYPSVRLRPNVLSAFDLEPSGFRHVISGDSKRYVPMVVNIPNNKKDSNWRFQPASCPLTKIYVLNSRNRNLDTLKMTRLDKQQAVMNLVPHSYGRRILDRQQQAQEFSFMVALSQHLPVIVLDRPDDLKQLPQIASAILADVHNDPE